MLLYVILYSHHVAARILSRMGEFRPAILHEKIAYSTYQSKVSGRVGGRGNGWRQEVNHSVMSV